jgi:hypothetical protein
VESIVVGWNTNLRWWQFSLRSLLILMTLACAILSVDAWRQARQRYLLRTVNSFNSLIDERQYAEATSLAMQARDWYPTPLTECMVEKAEFALSASMGKLPSGCIMDGDLCDGAFSDPAWDIGDAKNWDERSLAGKRSLKQSRSAVGRR